MKFRGRVPMCNRSHPLCKLLLERTARCQTGLNYVRVAGNVGLKFVTTFTLRCVQGPVGEHIRDNLMQPTTDRPLARARVFESAPKGAFDHFNNAVKLCNERDSFLGQGSDGKNLGGDHMMGGLVLK